jgi:hypothetical protein
MRRLAHVGLACGLVACGPDAANDERWPLPQLRLPSLSCAAPAEVRGECGRDADCARGQRCTVEDADALRDRDPPALHCRPSSGKSESRTECDDGSTCESGLCGLAGVCLAPCRQDTDCALGQACQPIEVRVPDGLAPVQACARVAAFASDVRLAQDQLAELRPATLNQRSFSAAGQVGAFFLKAECGRRLDVLRLAESGTERVLFDLVSQLEGRVQPNPVINAGSLVPILIPNNPRLGLARAYDITLRSDARSSLTLIRAWRDAPAHVLDLNVFYLGGGSSEQAGGLRPGSPAFAEITERLRKRLLAVGITLGEVHEVDVTGRLRDELSELELSVQRDEQGQATPQEVVNLDRVFALSAGLDRGGVNVFLLRSMGPLFGISGGTPGAVGLLGSAQSGLALALDTLGLARADRALLHEIGHQLGLFHTSESDGSSVEPLRDTPVCGREHDQNSDGLLRADECEGNGADNLMFWEGEGDAFSAEQRDVLSRSLVLR